MTGRLFVDGVDVFQEYGVYVISGGWNELVAMPPLKSVESNDWHEEDGEEVDLSAPVLDSRTVTIRFALRYADSHYFGFIQALSDGAYHTFDCRYIGRKFRLRLVGVGSFTTLDVLGEVVLKFADDFPLDGYTYKSPDPALPDNDRFQLDEVNLSEYGVHILQGTLSEVIKTPEVKPNLLRNITTQAGAIYDPLTVTYKAKDVKLSCLMRADSLTQLWRNWDALLYHLSRPNERQFWIDDYERTFPCYYRQCAVSEFYPEDKIWLRFDLTLTLTRDFRMIDDDTVLATQGGIIVFTQDDISAINLCQHNR